MINFGKMLKVKNTEISSYIFENPKNGVLRQNFWRIRIDYEEIKLMGYNLRCNTLCDPLKFSSNMWTKIVSEDITQDSQPQTYWSIYILGHVRFEPINASIKYIKEDILRVNFSTKRIINNEFDDPLKFNVDLTIDAKYQGLTIVPQNFGFTLNEPDKAIEIANEFVDLRDFVEPVVEKHVFLFKPKL